MTFIGKVGRDAWGDLCIKSLESFGVDCSSVDRDPSLTTGITVSITWAKDRAMLTYLGAIAALRASDVSDECLSIHRHLHVSSFFLQRALRPGLKSLLARAHANGLTTSIDPGFDPDEAWGKDLIDTLDEVDVFLPNEVELAAISGKKNRTEALHSLENGRTLIVAKLGPDGCMALDRGEIVSVPAFTVLPIDTTGAGDTFNAGFLHGWLSRSGLREAMRFGAACGALSTLGLGGTVNQPTDTQAREFMAEAAASA